MGNTGRRQRARERSQLARLVGRRVRALRLDRGWKQVDLEAHLYNWVKQATISTFESGQRFPSCTSLEAFAEAFGVDVAVLFLDPSDLRHRVAAAALQCRSAGTLQAIAKLLDVH